MDGRKVWHELILVLVFIKVVIGLLALAASMTALDGNEIRPQVVHGYPCIKRLNQLYCPSPGRKYPG